MAEYRIDELARVADATVRNIRVYQDRGLLPPPRRDGRVGLYTDAHLARLRLIGQLLKRGYTFAPMGELLTVWQRGGEIAEILDLESAVGLPWSDEVPAYVTASQLADLFGAEATPENVAQAVRQGLLPPDPAPQTPPARYRVPSPRLLNAGAELVAAGMPLPAVLDLAERLREHMDAARRDPPAAAPAGPDRGGRAAGPGHGPARPGSPGRPLRPRARPPRTGQVRSGRLTAHSWPVWSARRPAEMPVYHTEKYTLMKYFAAFFASRTLIR